MTSPRILIVKLSSIGDVVHALPSLMTVRKYYPTAYIAWAVEEKSYNLLVDNPYIDEVILFERKRIVHSFQTGHWINGVQHLRRLSSQLRAKQFDISLDLQGLARSAAVVYLAQAKTRIGCLGMREYSHLFSQLPQETANFQLQTAKQAQSVHAVDRSLHVIQTLPTYIKTLSGKEEKITPVLEFPIILTDAENRFAYDFLQQNQVYESDTIIGINIGASNPLKLWQPQKLAQLIDRIHQKQRTRVILFGGTLEIPLAHHICSLVSTTPLVAVGKTTLKQLAALAKRCKVFVSGDTGVLHIAAAMGIPVVALFGPDDPNKTGPYTEKKVVIRRKLACSPCFKTKYAQCPYRHMCMRMITVDEVISAVEKYIS